MQEMFCLHVGQCGIQIGFALWELLAAEHGINRDGKCNSEDPTNTKSYESFFNLSMSGQFVPRGIFVDLEPGVIDQMRKGSFSQLYHPDQLISGAEDAANNFARGYYTVGRIMKSSCENRIRKEFELSDKLQSIHIYRSLGGGTGSGMTATLFEVLLEYAKIAKIEIPILPSPHLTSAIVEPYNCILSEHFCIDDVDLSFLIDNEALYDIVTEKLDLKEPTFHSINRLVAQVSSALTASSRFENDLYNDFVSLTNLVPYPRIHFPLVSYAPFDSEFKVLRNVNSVSEITLALFQKSNQLVNCDPASGKYMSCSLVFRGNINPPEIYSTLSDIKSSRYVQFVDWCPTGFKVGIVNRPPQSLPHSHIGCSDKNVVMMTNTSSVSCVWHRLAQKFHKLYAKRSFVHWFVAEGLEECEFCESLYNMATLAKDYEEVALDTKVENERVISPVGEEGNKTPGGEAEGVKAEKSNDDHTRTSKSGADDEDDDEDEENENASNFCKMNNSHGNSDLSKKFVVKQFENLLEYIFENNELPSFFTKKRKKECKLFDEFKNFFSKKNGENVQCIIQNYDQRKFYAGSNESNRIFQSNNENLNLDLDISNSKNSPSTSSSNDSKADVDDSPMEYIKPTDDNPPCTKFSEDNEEVTASFLVQELIRIISLK